jgi:hypothetical protein
LLAPPAPGSPSPRQLTEFGSFSGASPALATDLPDETIEVIASVVVGNLVAGLDVLDGADLDHMLDVIDLRIGPACVVDVARPVPSAGAIDCPPAVDLEQIPVVDLIGDFGSEFPAAVSDYELALFDRHHCKKPEPSFRSADPEVT